MGFRSIILAPEKNSSRLGKKPFEVNLNFLVTKDL